MLLKYLRNRYLRIIILTAAVLTVTTELFAEGGGHGVVSGVGIAILAATVMAYIGHFLKQPLLLAYLAAGIVIGPRIGLGLIENMEHIETISEFGLILLLFLIGLEIDIKKLKESGKSLVMSGLTQFPLTVAAGLGFAALLGYAFGDGGYDGIYLAVCCGLSSTAIVVKLLYGKFELDTLAGRITLGILVFQDIWAIIVLGIQPNLANPDIVRILMSFGKGGLLVAASMLISRFVLPPMFKKVARVPELVLISSLGWCFFVCGGASLLGLSLEMGALIAGIAISTFPYNLDVIAKVVNIRDFFITLFFVSLGMKIPNPLDNTGIVATAGIMAGFLILSRFLTVFPVLYSLRNGLRVSLLTSINLSQLSEFSLVIASLGLAAGHISQDTMAVIIFTFVITSITSTYMVKYSDPIQRALSALMKKIGMTEVHSNSEGDDDDPRNEIALLGFYRTASSLLDGMLRLDEQNPSLGLKDRIVVVDFNPEIHVQLKGLGVRAVYGDISHPDTLHHAGIHEARLVISTIPDAILVGTDNLKILRHMKEISPHAKIIVTAESVERALNMYSEGAFYVFMPRILSGDRLCGIVEMFLEGKSSDLAAAAADEREALKARNELVR